MDREYIKESMKELNNQIVERQKVIKTLQEEIKNFVIAQEALRKVCNHEMEYEGRDSHNNYYKCIYCGYSSKG